MATSRNRTGRGPAGRRAEAGRGRLFAGGADDRRVIGVRDPWACVRWCSASSATQWISGVGKLRAGHHRRRFRPRRRARRDDRPRQRRAFTAAPVPPRTRALLHLRVHLFRAAGQRRRRPQRLRSAQAHRRRAGAGERRSTPISSSRCPIRACRRPSAMRRRAAFPFELGIIRNHYVGRTFIEPTDQIRHLGVKLKHNANRAMHRGQARRAGGRSIVRGTTSQKIVEMVRGAGATEVHMRIASPPTTPFLLLRRRHARARRSCWRTHTTSKRWRKYIGADSLAFISMDGLYRAVGERQRDSAQPQYLRRLLHRRLPDPTAGPRYSRRRFRSHLPRRSARLIAAIATLTS